MSRPPACSTAAASASRRRSAGCRSGNARSSSRSSTAEPVQLSGSAPPVFVITGPSGAGKGTLIRELAARVPVLEVAISATTRAQRPGEVDGREYWFLSEDDFARRVEEGEFLEHVEYVSGKRYGTLRSEVERIASHGRVCVLELELEGALAVQEQMPESVTIFIAANVAELERRLRERATESTGEIGERIELARHQLEQAHRFRYMVANDDLHRASEVLTAIVERELELAGTMTRDD